jgi:hypothetical protein
MMRRWALLLAILITAGVVCVLSASSATRPLGSVPFRKFHKTHTTQPVRVEIRNARVCWTYADPPSGAVDPDSGIATGPHNEYTYCARLSSITKTTVG